DLARGAGGDLVVGVDARDELVARPGLRTAVRADLRGLGEGIAQVAVPTLAQRLVEAEGHRHRLALVGIAQQGRVPVELAGAAAVLVAAAGVADGAPVAAAPVGHLAGRRVVQAGGRVA